MNRRYSAYMAILISVALCVAAGAGEGKTVILGKTSFWRQHFTFKTPVVKKEDGTLAPAPMTHRGKCECGKKGLRVETALPSDGWMKTDFDDTQWVRLPTGVSARWQTGRPCGGGISGRVSSYLQMLCHRSGSDQSMYSRWLPFSVTSMDTCLPRTMAILPFICPAGKSKHTG